MEMFNAIVVGFVTVILLWLLVFVVAIVVERHEKKKQNKKDKDELLNLVSEGVLKLGLRVKELEEKVKTAQLGVKLSLKALEHILDEKIKEKENEQNKNSKENKK